MADYKESSISGTSWVRCKTVTITNPIAGTTQQDARPGHMGEIIAVVPTVYFQEEKVLQIGTDKILTDSGYCSKEFDAVNGSIPLRNPSTGDLLGTSVSHSELYVILYSLYLQTAMERDAA